MSLSSYSIAGSDFGSEYMYLKFLNKLLESESTRRSDNSLIAEAYRNMFYSDYYYANNLLNDYLNANNINFLSNDDAVVYERTGIYNAANYLNLINYMFGEYEPDAVLPLNSTVSYHV